MTSARKELEAAAEEIERLADHVPHGEGHRPVAAYLDAAATLRARASRLPASTWTVEDEREACAEIALAIDSGRGNEKEIARAIRSRTTPTATTEKEIGECQDQ